MLILKKYFMLSFVFLVAIGSSACTTLKSTDSLDSQRLSDPIEGINRSVYAFNVAADNVILKPAAKAYRTLLPDSAERGISRFFKNLGEPLNIVNNLLQGKVDGALNSTYRFTVNSTIGLLGFLDVAKSLDVERKPEDFGQTLAAWRVKPGPYIMLPFLGPTTLRDGAGRIIDTAALYPINKITHSNSGRLALTAVDNIDKRVSLLGIDDTLNNQLDPYLFLRDAYENSRINAIYDGTPPETVDDFDF